jgi:hypothetical protein
MGLPRGLAAAGGAGSKAAGPLDAVELGAARDIGGFRQCV